VSGNATPSRYREGNIKKKPFGKHVIKDFIRAFSCAYSMSLNLGKVLGIDTEAELLQSVVGFSSGVSTMGDTCGSVNGGVLVLGRRYNDNVLEDVPFYHLCAAYFERLENLTGTPNCGIVHGGRHLASNFRRAILTGKPLTCMSIMNHAATVLTDLSEEVENNTLAVPETDNDPVNIMARHFNAAGFHCCRSVLDEVAQKTGRNMDTVRLASRGFAGGIGFNGTLCGAIAGGVLALGQADRVDLNRSGYLGSAGIIAKGLIVSDRIFDDRKRFPAAELFGRCRRTYQNVESQWGCAHCRDILALDISTSEGARQYIADNRMNTCRDIVQNVAASVVDELA